MIVQIPNGPARRNQSRTTTYRRALASTLLAMGLALTLIAAGTTEARSTPPPMAEPASTSIPDTPAGHQLRWFLEETKSLPIPVPAIEENCSADLASHGYLVAVLEHPGEFQFVEFPDGSIVPPGLVDSEGAEAALLPVRIADIGAARGLLARLDAEPGGPMHNYALDLGRVALAGHSFGGAAAAEAMRTATTACTPVSTSTAPCMAGSSTPDSTGRSCSSARRGTWSRTQPGPRSGHARHRRRPWRSPAPTT